MRVRLVPLVILFSFILVVVKLSDILFKESDVAEYQYSPISAKAQEEEVIDNDEEPEYSPGASSPEQIEPSDISQMEREILQNLSKRRQELDEWNKSISMKENILNATEKKINRKMEELKKLEKEVSELLKEYTSRENRKIKRLVKIYENMKPKDAARIFEDMELSILLEVIDNMKEAKAAPILAKMDANKAKDITLQLAKQRRLSINTGNKP